MKLQDVIDNYNHELDVRAEQAQKEDDAYAKRQSEKDLQAAVAAEGGEVTQTEEQRNAEYQQSMDTAESEHVQSDQEYYRDHPSVRAEMGRAAASATVLHAAATSLGVSDSVVEKPAEQTKTPEKPKKKKKKPLRYDPRNPLTWDPRFRG